METGDSTGEELWFLFPFLDLVLALCPLIWLSPYCHTVSLILRSDWLALDFITFKLIDWVCLILCWAFFSEFLEASTPLPLLPECWRSLLVSHRALECFGAPYTRALPLFCAKSFRVSFSKVQFFLLALSQGLIILVYLYLGLQHSIF